MFLFYFLFGLLFPFIFTAFRIFCKQFELGIGQSIQFFHAVQQDVAIVRRRIIKHLFKK